MKDFKLMHLLEIIIIWYALFKLKVFRRNLILKGFTEAEYLIPNIFGIKYSAFCLSS